MSVHLHEHTDVAAWVDDEPVTVDELDGRTAELRQRAFGVRLPHERTAEGRNARRWVLQLLCAERLVRHEARQRGVPFGTRGDLSLGPALAMGGVAAAVVAAGGAAVAEAVTAGVQVEDATVESYFRRNRDRFPGQDFGDVRSQIAGELLFAARGRAFATWLDAATAARVTLAPGFVHPAEPGHPDATHRH